MELKGTASIKMREIDHSHVKETSFIHMLVINLKKTACSFRMFERSYVGQHRSFKFIRHYDLPEVSCGMLTIKGLRGLYKLFETFVFSPFSAHGVKPYFHRMYSQGGKVTFGNICYVPLIFIDRLVCSCLPGGTMLEGFYGRWTTRYLLSTSHIVLSRCGTLDM